MKPSKMLVAVSLVFLALLSSAFFIIDTTETTNIENEKAKQEEPVKRISTIEERKNALREVFK